MTMILSSFMIAPKPAWKANAGDGIGLVDPLAELRPDGAGELPVFHHRQMPGDGLFAGIGKLR
ncbi:hypothetical protein HB771_36540 (plasmid) [Rhizobium leguminosarum bv. viciae]|nr:hypothetical protein HB771_36540 [Rhizobium leguminosarum bv. viciae]